MTDLEIELPANLNPARVPTIVEEACASANLYTTMKSTLKKFPGCVHWHFKTAKEKGVLEATWWPREPGTTPPRLWLSVHGNRTADWIERLGPELAASIKTRLAVSGTY